MMVNSETHEAWELPEPSGWVGQPAKIETDGSTATLTISQSKDNLCVVSFEGVRAIRHNVEQLADPKVVGTNYDRLAEVTDSPWLAEMVQLAEARGGWDRPMKHFAIFLDGGGSYELIAESWRVSG